MSKSLATWFTPSLQVFQRSKGRSAVAAAAYRACVKLEDERTGLAHDYTRKLGHVSTELFGVEGLNLTMADIGALWNAAEIAETRRNSAVARELMVPLPHEWTDDQRRQCVRGFSEMLVSRYGVAVMASIHRPADGQNDHVHIQFTTRMVDKDMKFGKKTRILDDAKTGEVKKLREEICRIVNEHAEQYGNDWYVYAGKFCEVEGMEEHIPTKHIPRLAAPEVIESIKTYNTDIIEYRALKDERNEIEEERERIQKIIEAEEEKRRYYPKASVAFDPIIAEKHAPRIFEIDDATDENRIPAVMPLYLTIARNHFEALTFKKKSHHQERDEWKREYLELKKKPPDLERNWLGLESSASKQRRLEYDEKLQSLRAGFKECNEKIQRVDAAINVPDLQKKLKQYDEINARNAAIEAMAANKTLAQSKAWVQKIKHDPIVLVQSKQASGPKPEPAPTPSATLEHPFRMPTPTLTIPEP